VEQPKRKEDVGAREEETEKNLLRLHRAVEQVERVGASAVKVVCSLATVVLPGSTVLRIECAARERDHDNAAAAGALRDHCDRASRALSVPVQNALHHVHRQPADAHALNAQQRVSLAQLPALCGRAMGPEPGDAEVARLVRVHELDTQRLPWHAHRRHLCRATRVFSSVLWYTLCRLPNGLGPEYSPLEPHELGVKRLPQVRCQRRTMACSEWTRSYNPGRTF
jgi:hypothetical protein